MIGKAIANEFDCPFFKVDLGALFDSLVGNTEKNMRELISTIEAMGRCVVLLDEAEKSLNTNAVSGASDSGTSSRIFGTLLTWLNDRTCPAFIVATSNDHTVLPPALVRKGRFDLLCWMDVPTQTERAEICAVVIKKYGRNPEDFDLKAFANLTEDFTGAEIEYVFTDALFKAFSADEEVADKHVALAAKQTVPFALSHAEDLQRMRAAAEGKLQSVADDEEVVPVTSKARALRIS